MTQPLTIRADTPRDAVEEVCKWLEAEVAALGRRGLHTSTIAAAYDVIADRLRAARVVPTGAPSAFQSDEMEALQKTWPRIFGVLLAMEKEIDALRTPLADKRLHEMTREELAAYSRTLGDA
jgi:hypothetical protein